MEGVITHAKSVEVPYSANMGGRGRHVSHAKEYKYASMERSEEYALIVEVHKYASTSEESLDANIATGARSVTTEE